MSKSHQDAIDLVVQNVVAEVRDNRFASESVKTILRAVLDGVSERPEAPRPPAHFMAARAWFQASFTISAQLETLWLSRLSTRFTEEFGWELWSDIDPMYASSEKELDTGKRVPTLAPGSSIYYYSEERRILVHVMRGPFDVDVVINSEGATDVDEAISEVEDFVLNPDPFKNRIVRLDADGARVLSVDVGEIQKYEPHVEAEAKWLTSIANPIVRERLTKADLPNRAGLLLEGPPGSGKTTLARRIASELEGTVTVVYPTADMAVEDIFLFTRRYEVVLLVLEDVESFFGERGSNSFSNFLNELDGISNDEALMLLATTNDASKFDAAIRRPGRLERSAIIAQVKPGAHYEMLASRLTWESEETLREVLDAVIKRVKLQEMTPALLDSLARTAIMLSLEGDALVEYTRTVWTPKYTGSSHL